MVNSIFLFTAAVIVCFLITWPVLWVMRFFHAFQAIRKEGPASHQAKAGTPTMGGLGFVATIIIFGLIFTDFDLNQEFLVLLLLIMAFALIGFIDDLIKIVRHQNLGLTFGQKLGAQIVAAAIFSLVLIIGFGRVSFGQPVLSFVCSVFIIVGSANATNLTDGLNGLLAGTALIAFLFLGILSARAQSTDAATLCFVGAGAVAAFLYFNFPQAKLFMGDIGALAIGAALAGIAIIIRQELLLALIGGVFVLEALSVIIQVTSFKLFKQRVFKMTPLHHHFELLGFSEIQIVISAWLLAALFGLVSLLVC